jgi:hypothetical protein
MHDHLYCIMLFIIITAIISLTCLFSLPSNCQKYLSMTSTPTNTQIIPTICYNTCLNKRVKYSCNPYLCYKKITQFTEINNTKSCNYYQISSTIESLNVYSNTTIYNVYYNTSNICFFQQNNNLPKCNYLDNLFIGSIGGFISLVILLCIYCCYLRFCNITTKMYNISNDVTHI